METKTAASSCSVPPRVCVDCTAKFRSADIFEERCPECLSKWDREYWEAMAEHARLDSGSDGADRYEQEMSRRYERACEGGGA